jgi:hypothetical protein
MATFVRATVLILAGASLSLTVAVDATAKKLTPAQVKACIKKFNIDPNGTENKSWWHAPTAGSCHFQVFNGRTYPDRNCTPGALNPSVTAATLKSPGFTTQCIRNQATGSSETQKSIVFSWYGIKSDSTCEKDHFVPLEVGGADTLDNIWPECGPTGAAGNARFFKQKDGVETYFGKQVKGTMSQSDAENAIKSDWTRYLAGGPSAVPSAAPSAPPAAAKPRPKHKKVS